MKSYNRGIFFNSHENKKNDLLYIFDMTFFNNKAL